MMFGIGNILHHFVYIGLILFLYCKILLDGDFCQKEVGLGPKNLDDFVESPGSETMELLADIGHLNHPHAILAFGVRAIV